MSSIKPIEKVKNFFSKRKMKITSEIEGQVKDIEKMEQDIKNNEKNLHNYRDGWSTSSIFKFWLIGLLVVALGYFSYNVLNWIFLIISAYVVSVIVEALVSIFEKKMKRSFALALAYLIFIIVLLGIFIILIPFLINQCADLISLGLKKLAYLQTIVADKGVVSIISDSGLPVYFKDIILDYISNNDFSSQIQTILQTNISGIISAGSTYASYIGSWFVSFISSFTTFFMHFFLFITLAILFSVDKKNIISFLSGLGGKDRESIYKLKIKKMYKNLAVWLKSRLLLSVFVALAVGITLVILGWCGIEIHHKLGITILTALLDFVPYIGPIFTGILICLAIMIYNPLWVALLFLVLLWVFNFVQENILTPVVMKKSLGISPVLILIAMMLGGVIMGFMGILLAVPIAAILVILFENKSNDDISVGKDTKPLEEKINNDIVEIPEKKRTTRKSI